MLRIMPLEQLRQRHSAADEALAAVPAEGNADLRALIGEHRYYSCGKDAIRALVEHLGLRREDEVWISTTTDSSFVSTCVSATIFNYCKISRVPSDNTKAVFVIHSFGFPNPELPHCRSFAQKRGIPLIEDSAFSFDACYADGTRVGATGDYAIYSLPKIFPLESGGLLAGKSLPQGGASSSGLQEAVAKWLPRLPWLTSRRRSNYNFLMGILRGETLYGKLSGQTPFMYGFKTTAFSRIYAAARSVELGRTHVANEVHVPVNPFAEPDELKKAAEEINAISDIGSRANTP